MQQFRPKVMRIIKERRRGEENRKSLDQLQGASRSAGETGVTWKLLPSARGRRRYFRNVDRRGENPISDLNGGRRNALRSGFWLLFRVAQWKGLVRRSTRRSMPGWIQSPDLSASL